MRLPALVFFFFVILPLRLKINLVSPKLNAIV